MSLVTVCLTVEDIVFKTPDLCNPGLNYFMTVIHCGKHHSNLFELFLVELFLCPNLLECLHDADDDPSRHLATDKSGTDFQKYFRSFQKSENVFQMLSIDFTDNPSHLFESSIVDKSDNFSDGGYKFGYQEWLVGISKVSWKWVEYKLSYIVFSGMLPWLSI